MSRKYQVALTFDQRHAVIEEARERFVITVRDDGTWAAIDGSCPSGPTFFSCVQQYKYLGHVQEWAASRTLDNWLGFNNDPISIELYGPHALKKRSRFPPWWLLRLSPQVQLGDVTSESVLIDVPVAAVHEPSVTKRRRHCTRGGNMARGTASGGVAHASGAVGAAVGGVGPVAPVAHAIQPSCGVADASGAVGAAVSDVGHVAPSAHAIQPSCGVHDGVSAAPLKLGTKKTLMEKFPDLQVVINRWIALHEAGRDDDTTVTFQDNWETFNKRLTEGQWEFAESGLVGMLPKTVSVGWFCKMKKQYGAHDSSVQSTEVRRDTPRARYIQKELQAEVEEVQHPK